MANDSDSVGFFAAVALEDGRIFRGTSIGATVDAEGEVVFTTTMTGCATS